MNWELYAYATKTESRRKILLALENPLTPTAIGKATGIRPSQVSRTLGQFKEKGLVVCTTPELRVGRVYALTEEGKAVFGRLDNPR